MKIYMTIGISGSGKTTWCAQNAKSDDIVLDSDNVRLALYGDAECQDNPGKVFDVMRRNTIEGLRANHNIFYCATNLSMKKRIAFIKEMKKLFPDVEIIAVVFAILPKICKERNGTRERVVPNEVIDRQVRQFQIPVENEGWSDIIVVRNPETNPFEWKYQTWTEMEEFGDQKNKHHSLPLYLHCVRCYEKMLKFGDKQVDRLTAALWHDCGKLYTQTYWEKDDDAHYPNHAEVGSYYFLAGTGKIYTSQLIAYHMMAYQEEHAREVWRARLGDKLWEDIELLHQCDEAAH